MQGLRPQEGGNAHEAEIMTLSWVFVMVIYYPGGGAGVFAHWENGPFQLGSDRALGGFQGQQLGGAAPVGMGWAGRRKYLGLICCHAFLIH